MLLMKCEIADMKSHSTYAMGWWLWTLCRVLRRCQDRWVPRVCPWLHATQRCPRLSLGLTFFIRRTPYLIDSTSHTHAADLLKLVKVLRFINLGILSSYWPWNISSFTEKLFLKEGCQRPFWGRLRKVSTSALGGSTHLHSPFPSGLRTRRAARSMELAKDTLSVTTLLRRENEQPCV